MLLIAPSDGRPVPPLPKSAGINEEIKNEIYTCWYGVEFRQYRLENGSCLLISGNIFGLSDTYFSGKSEETVENTLKEAVGYFIAVILNNDSFSICSSLYRFEDIFYWNDEAGWWICSDLALLPHLNKTAGLSTSFLRDFALDHISFGKATAFDGIYQVEIGAYLTFAGGGLLTKKVGNYPTIAENDFVEITTNNLRYLAARETPAILAFSGGLDSSLVLGSARAAHLPVSALHVIGLEDSSSTEIDFAYQAAHEFGVEMKVLHSKFGLAGVRDYFEFSRNVSSPYDVYPFSLDATDRKMMYHEQLDFLGLQDAIFLSGQGGDSVFLQNPEPVLLKTLLKQRRLISFFRETFKLSSMRNTPIFETLREAFCFDGSYVDGAQNMLRTSASPSHFLLEGNDLTKERFYHIRGILEALYAHERPSEAGMLTLHPLLFQNVVSKAISVPIEASYSKQYDRILERQALYDRFGVSVSWRRSKRSASNAIFLFLKYNTEAIVRTLCGGIVAAKLEIDDGWLRQQIVYNSTVGLTPSIGLLINLLRLEIFLKGHIATIR
jgi:hypothetical protein